MQALVEGIGFGIPANNSSDPRNSANATAEYNAGAGGKISMWPEPLGLAATFDPKMVQQFGNIAARNTGHWESPLPFHHRSIWVQNPAGCGSMAHFGEDPKLAEDMARAYVDGFQTSYGAG